MNGIEAAKHMKGEAPDISIIGLYVENRVGMVQRMHTTGIFAYLKNESIAAALGLHSVSVSVRLLLPSRGDHARCLVGR